MIEFVTASHDESILWGNLKRSPIFQSNHYLSVVTGFDNIPKAYNQIGPITDYMCYLHHDVYLPDGFEKELRVALERMKDIDPNWGVLGVAGVKFTGGVKTSIGHIEDRGRKWGARLPNPEEVDTLDELLLIAQSDFMFDEQFDLHFYGADICMQAKLQGRKNYAIEAYCQHNSGLPIGYRSDSFRKCEAKFRAKYINHLPIATTCSILLP